MKEISIHITSTCACGHEYEEVLHVENASFSLSTPPIPLNEGKGDKLFRILEGRLPTIEFTGSVSKIDVIGIATKHDPTFRIVCPVCGKDLVFDA